MPSPLAALSARWRRHQGSEKRRGRPAPQPLTTHFNTAESAGSCSNFFAAYS